MKILFILAFLGVTVIAQKNVQDKKEIQQIIEKSVQKVNLEEENKLKLFSASTIKKIGLCDKVVINNKVYVRIFEDHLNKDHFILVDSRQILQMKQVKEVGNPNFYEFWINREAIVWDVNSKQIHKLNKKTKISDSSYSLDKRITPSVVGGTIDDNSPGYHNGIARLVCYFGNKPLNSTATRVGKKTFLTAAHCLYKEGNKTDKIYILRGAITTIRFPLNDIDKFTPEKVNIHPLYRAPSLRYDIAFFTIKDSDISRISSMPIVNISYDYVRTPTRAIFYGYGRHSFGIRIDGRRRYGEVNLLSHEECRDLGVTSAYLAEQGIGRYTIDPLIGGGDSGGPLMLLQSPHRQNSIIGVNSGGLRQDYSIFTRIDLPDISNWLKNSIE